MDPENDTLTAPILPAEQQSSSPTSKIKKRVIIPTVVFGAIASTLLYITTNSILNPAPLPGSTLYSVIIDAGSSKSGVHVFKYTIDQSGKPVFNFDDDNYKKEKFDDGLATFGGNLPGARVRVRELVDFAKTIVPEAMRSTCDIRLMATAGMRLIDHEARKNILNIVKEVLASSGFRFNNDWASVISGSDEGLYAWVIANHASGSLGNTEEITTGIMEFGGASVQVAFVSSDMYVFPVDVRKETYTSVPYRIYSHSFPDSGKDTALKKLLTKLQNSANGDGNVQDPCTPQGYTYQNNIQNYLSVFLADESGYTNLVAAGNFEACKTKTVELLMERNEMCPLDYSCGIGSTYTPPLKGNFFATGNFLYTKQFFNLVDDDWMHELRRKGVVFCRKTWEALKREYPLEKKEFLRGYCFSAAYIVSMFERLGVNQSRIRFSGEENNIPLDWALGAFIDTALRPSISPAPSPAPTSGGDGTSRRLIGF